MDGAESDGQGKRKYGIYAMIGEQTHSIILGFELGGLCVGSVNESVEHNGYQTTKGKAAVVIRRSFHGMDPTGSSVGGARLMQILQHGAAEPSVV